MKSRTYNKKNTRTGNMVRFDWSGDNEPTEAEIAEIEKGQSGSSKLKPTQGFFSKVMSGHPIDAVSEKLQDVDEFVGHQMGNAPVPQSMGDVGHMLGAMVPAGLKE